MGVFPGGGGGVWKGYEGSIDQSIICPIADIYTTDKLPPAHLESPSPRANSSPNRGGMRYANIACDHSLSREAAGPHRDRFQFPWSTSDRGNLGMSRKGGCWEFRRHRKCKGTDFLVSFPSKFDNRGIFKSLEMANIAVSRIKREFKEVVTSEEVRNLDSSEIKCVGPVAKMQR